MSDTINVQQALARTGLARTTAGKLQLSSGATLTGQLTLLEHAVKVDDGSDVWTVPLSAVAAVSVTA